jgi:hypothetical protein
MDNFFKCYITNDAVYPLMFCQDIYLGTVTVPR